MLRPSAHAFLTAAAGCGLICIAACTTADGPQASDGDQADAAEMDMGEPLVIPAVPAVQPGRVTVAGVGDVKPEYEIDGSWAASATRCDSAGYIQLTARGEGFGAAFLFAPPDSGTVATSYEVVNEDQGPMAAGTARIGIQWYPGERAYVFRGAHGSLEVTRAGDRLAGYVTAESYETTFLDSMYLAASFADVGVEPGTPPVCRLIPADTSAAVRDLGVEPR